MRFTDRQTAAIQADNPQLLVSAAAGSGKTAVLVERIFHMISTKGMSIDRMLIVTFTRAAAAEMRERLETRLNEAAQDNPALQKQAELVSMAQISTIHSFCQKIVRQNFQHCKVDPQFTLSDERERDRLFQEALNETLDQVYQNAAADSELLSLLSKYTERELSTMLSLLHGFLLSRPNPMEWLEKHARKTWSANTLDREPMAMAFCSEASLMVQGMLSIWEESARLAKHPEFPERYLDTIVKDEAALRALNGACGSFTGLAGALRGIKFSTLARVAPQSEAQRALAEQYKECRARYKDLTDELKKLLPVDCDAGIADLRAMEPATRGLAKAVRLLHEIFLASKQEQGVLDFNDLEHLALDVLSDEKLRQRLSDEFDAIFVDEYQDVSALQDAILGALMRKNPPGAPQFVFYVGDVKQSIYRFRLAEPALFLGKLNAFSVDPRAERRKIILNQNFRSRSGVLDAVNRVFEHVMDSRVTEIDYDEDARLFPGSPSVCDPATEIHVLNSAGHKPAEMARAEAVWIARDILAGIGTPVLDAQGAERGILHYRDIAILLPVSKNIADKVEAVLTAAGIPVYCENASDSLKSGEVTQVVQHLQLMDNLMNDVALISELRSPLFEMDERELARVRLLKPEKEASFLEALCQGAECAAEEALLLRCRDVLKTLEEERFLYRSMSLDLYLWDFLQRSGLYAHYGAQPGGKLRQANLRMLCHKAGEYAKAHGEGLRGFLEAIGNESSGGVSPAVINPWEDVVRIMTIHKSKGLEFPTVYVMGLGGSLRRRTATKAVGMHSDIGFGLGYVNEHARTKRVTLLQSAITLRERAEDRAERARVLYVAMTRAKSRLVLVGSENEARCGYSDTLATAKAWEPGKQNPFSVRAAHSMLEWILQCVRPGDRIERLAKDGFPTEEVRESWEEAKFPTDSTSFPHKTAGWRVVFHSEPDFSTKPSWNPTVLPLAPLLAQSVSENPIRGKVGDEPPEADPLAPRLELIHRPLKLGVTSLCQSLETSGQTAGDSSGLPEEETAEEKRYPLSVFRPRLLGDLPSLPAFLNPPKEERALQAGVQTHRLLGALELAGARMTAASPDALRAFLRGEVDRLKRQGVMTGKEAELANVDMAARFLESGLGARMLAAPTVRREWSFNLRVREPFDTILQGVIDLCFLENEEWVLVDFKTDRVDTADALRDRYQTQMDYYGRALALATPYPVGARGLFSLRLGEVVWLPAIFS